MFKYKLVSPPSSRQNQIVVCTASWKNRRAAAEKKRQAHIKTIHDQLVTISKSEISFIQSFSKDASDKIRDLWRNTDTDTDTDTYVEIAEDYFKKTD